MTLLNMKNVIQISSLNKLIVGSKSEHAIIYTRQALITSVRMYLCIYVTNEKKTRERERTVQIHNIRSIYFIYMIDYLNSLL
jgi:hypothetical protein